MEEKAFPEEFSEEKFIIKAYEPEKGHYFLVDITIFSSVLHAFYEATDKKIKQKRIKQLLSDNDWYEHYQDRNNGRRVLSESEHIEHAHELETAIKLAQMNYDVVFAPNGMFERKNKRFDVFLIRESILLKADLKSISSKNPDTIARRIKDGSDQTNRIIIDIRSDIEKKVLIDGLRGGCYKNKLLKEILLFYKGRFYILPINLIVSKNIFTVIK